ncbi:SHOCT domain-containing protein [Haloterrigena alkaliphila]|uniref:SHOCT domain-containing protein n=1 Tax=Haloterrigena alkaliphila TaxID=2816475 RepID=UPI001D00084D|nr:SHOCT domain-containing protein [Haloterrigena alkaliphila]UHQ95160.1 SHOCT domain-containing protein [Haloterrigena alkaliphila]
MTDPHETIGRYASRATAFAAVLLVAATATASAQPHGGGAGGGMGGWGAFGGWMFLWPIVLLGLLALLIVWAGSRRRGDRIDRTDRADRPDRALEELRERYARGEISEDEFERRRRNLQPYTND